MLACRVQWDELLICCNLAKLRSFTVYFQNKSLMALQHGSGKEVDCNYWGMVCVCVCGYGSAGTAIDSWVWCSRQSLPTQGQTDEREARRQRSNRHNRHIINRHMSWSISARPFFSLSQTMSRKMCLFSVQLPFFVVDK